MNRSEPATQPPFSIAVERLQHVCVVRPAGELDIATASQLRIALLERTIDHGYVDIAVDLTDVTFMDSTGLGVLVAALKRTRALEGSFAVVCPPGPVRRVVIAAGLFEVLRVHDSLDALTTN